MMKEGKICGLGPETPILPRNPIVGHLWKEPGFGGFPQTENGMTWAGFGPCGFATHGSVENKIKPLDSTNTIQQGVQSLVEIGILLHACLHRIDGIHHRAVMHVVERAPDIAEG